MEQKNNAGALPEDKKKSRRAVLLFALILLCSLLLGVALGLGIAASEKNGLDLAALFRSAGEAFASAAWLVNLLAWAAALLLCGLLHRNAKKRLAAWDGEDEDASERIDTILSASLAASNTALFIDLLCIASSACSVRNIPSLPLFLFGLGTELLGLLLGTALQNTSVKLAKRLYPEKRGELLSPRFQKEWLASMDEAEIAQTHAAAFASFRTMRAAFPVAWVVCVFAGLAADVGFFPGLVVTLLWAAASMSYMLSARRLGLRGKERKNERNSPKTD